MTGLVGFVAVCCSTGLLGFWFWKARLAIEKKQNMIESAQLQLETSYGQWLGAKEVYEAQKLLKRSINIYEQSVQRYNETLNKPWNRLPGYCMGYRLVEAEKGKGGVL